MAKAIHPHYHSEQGLLKKVWSYLQNYYEELSSKILAKEIKKSSAIQGGKEGYGEVTVLNREIREIEARAEIVSRQLERPYFGKIKYVENGKLNTIYISREIGKSATSCPYALIVSPNADVANMYFSQQGSYFSTSEGREKTVELHLVQTLDVSRNKLIEIYDLYIKESQIKYDPFLQKQLKRTGKERLRDVIVTIQKEQNEIIRAPIDKHLIVQGSAGTGKTIVLVYRVAYLLYTYNWNLDDVLIISPSRVFLTYLRSILPDADLRDIPNISLDELFPQIGKRMLQSLNQFPGILEVNKKERGVAADSAGFKGTLAFKRMIDLRVQEVSKRFISMIKDFTFISFWTEETISATIIKRWILEDFSKLPLENRKKMVRERLKIRLENVLDGSKKQPVRKYSHQQTESMLADYFQEWPDFKKVFQSDMVPWYFNLLKSYGDVGAILENSQTQISETVSSWSKYFSMFTLNDWAAIFYMYQQLVGLENRSYKHIVIDEAQMLSPIWLTGLSCMLANGGTFTLAGDINQKPAVVDLPDWDGYEEIIGNVEIMQLDKCYRLTDNIAKVALDVLMKHPSLYQFETIGRIGEEVKVIDSSGGKKFKAIIVEISQLLKQYPTIAVAGRTVADCENLYHQLRYIFPEAVLLIENDELKGRLFIIPVNLIGGLEFDAVVIINHTQYKIEDIYEAQQLYLAVTRAVHKLILA